VRPSRRVLVVEDDVKILDMVAGKVAAGGFEVEKAAGLAEATAKVDRRTYAAMIVDISLQGGNDDKDGLALLTYANQLGEGTPVIMLTSNPDPQVAADAVQKMGAFRYFSKSSLASLGTQVLVDTVRAAVSKDSLNLYQGASDIVESLCGRVEAELWADRCLRAFKPKGGFVGLRSFLDGLLTAALPLRPLVTAAAEQRLALDELHQLMRGVFWSKGFGVGVEITVVAEGHRERLGHQSQSALKEHGHAGLLGVVRARPDLAREEFA